MSHVILYGCGTLCPAVREERRVLLFVNVVLRRIFEPKRKEVTNDSKRFRNEETGFTRMTRSRKMM
jgi:hypothetical protein